MLVAASSRQAVATSTSCCMPTNARTRRHATKRTYKQMFASKNIETLYRGSAHSGGGGRLHQCSALLHATAYKCKEGVYVCVRICACAQRKSYIIIYICARSLSNAMKTADVDIARQCRQVKVVALQIEAVYSNNNNTTTIISYHI